MLPRVKRFLGLALWLVLACAGTVRADRYTLRAELDDHAHVVRGDERLVFTNASTAPVDHLVFHLYMNAFAHGRTVFMRESGGKLRGVRTRGHGGIRVLSMRALGADLLRDAERELVPNDETQLRVRLPQAIAPGGSVAIDIRFETTLPEVSARAGYSHDFHVVAQWFPKLAKLEADGHFASFPYHGDGEFYADFATYDLTVITDEALTVGASGHLVRSRAIPEGRMERRYFADRVHDVAFVASRHFRTRERTCARVDVHTLHPPGYEGVARRQTDVTCHALAWLGETYGAYPYVDLTVVLPPRGAEGAAGMEYPTLFLTAGSWFDTELLGIDEATETTVHELVHQWFQGIVATNEVRYPFLDEGITSFVTSDYRSTIEPRAVDARTEAMRRFTWPRNSPAPASHVSTFRSKYGAVVYGRSQMILETVARTWGREKIRAALGRYARTERFAHPGPRELFAAFDATYYPGFAEEVLRPLFMDGDTVRLRAGTRPGGLVVERTGPRSIPIDVLYVDTRGRRSLRRFGDARTLTFGPGCVTVDPFRKSMLDTRRTDDHVCTAESRSRSSYVERLAAVLAAFMGTVP